MIPALAAMSTSKPLAEPARFEPALLEYVRQARSDGVPDGNRFNLVTTLRF